MNPPSQADRREARGKPTAPRVRSRVIGHGELLKALNALPGRTSLYFNIAGVYLAHATPPTYAVFVTTQTIVRIVGCSKKSVENCRRWMKDGGAILLRRGGGRGRSTTIDFAPLAERINSERRSAKIAETAKVEGETANFERETAKDGAPVYEKDPKSRTLVQGPDAKRVTTRPPMIEVARSMVAAEGYSDQDIVAYTGVTTDGLADLKAQDEGRRRECAGPPVVSRVAWSDCRASKVVRVGDANDD